MASIDDLVKLTDELGKPIMHQTLPHAIEGEVYFMLDNFNTAPPKLSSRHSALAWFTGGLKHYSPFPNKQSLHRFHGTWPPFQPKRRRPINNVKV